MRKTGVNWVPWSTCLRCGFWYPLNQLVSQKGLRVCTTYCFDNTDIEYRPYDIEQVLGDDAEEGVSLTHVVQENPEEILF